MSNTATWICDKCREPVTVQDGWVEMISDLPDGFLDEGNTERTVYREYRIVHKTTCKTRGLPPSQQMGDLSLFDMVGPDGLMRLLGHAQYNEGKNLLAVTEIIKRLFVPNFDAVRPYIQEAEAEERLHPRIGERCYHQIHMLDTLKWVREREVI